MLSTPIVSTPTTPSPVIDQSKSVPYTLVFTINKPDLEVIVRAPNYPVITAGATRIEYIETESTVRWVMDTMKKTISSVDNNGTHTVLDDVTAMKYTRHLYKKLKEILLYDSTLTHVYITENDQPVVSNSAISVFETIMEDLQVCMGNPMKGLMDVLTKDGPTTIHAANLITLIQHYLGRKHDYQRVLSELLFAPVKDVGYDEDKLVWTNLVLDFEFDDEALSFLKHTRTIVPHNHTRSHEGMNIIESAIVRDEPEPHYTIQFTNISDLVLLQDFIISCLGRKEYCTWVRYQNEVHRSMSRVSLWLGDCILRLAMGRDITELVSEDSFIWDKNIDNGSYCDKCNAYRPVGVNYTCSACGYEHVVTDDSIIRTDASTVDKVQELTTELTNAVRDVSDISLSDAVARELCDTEFKIPADIFTSTPKLVEAVNQMNAGQLRLLFMIAASDDQFNTTHAIKLFKILNENPDIDLNTLAKGIYLTM